MQVWWAPVHQGFWITIAGRSCLPVRNCFNKPPGEKRGCEWAMRTFLCCWNVTSLCCWNVTQFWSSWQRTIVFNHVADFCACMRWRHCIFAPVVLHLELSARLWMWGSPCDLISLIGEAMMNSPASQWQTKAWLKPEFGHFFATVASITFYKFTIGARPQCGSCPPIPHLAEGETVDHWFNRIPFTSLNGFWIPYMKAIGN